MHGKGKILVIRGGAIGDFILTTPVLAALRQQFPNTAVDVLGYPHIVQLALNSGLADDVRSIESRALAGFFARGGQLDSALVDYFSQFAIIISYLYDPDRIFQQNVGLCSDAQFIAGPHRPDDTAGVHATEVFLKPLERLAIFGADPSPHLDFPATARPKLPPGRWLAVHPGSGSDAKNWPEASWLDFLERVTGNTDLNILLVGGEAEGARLDHLRATLPAGRTHLARNQPLPELARLLRASVAYVGHDSGISHLAAAVGLPGLVLWNQTVEAVWRPQSPRMRVVRDPQGLTRLPPTRVFQFLNSVLGQASSLPADTHPAQN